MSRYLPYGVFSVPGAAPRVGVAVGDHVLDLAAAADAARSPHLPLVTEPSLNRLLAAGRPVWQEIRARVREWAADRRHLLPRAGVRMHLPFEVTDFVDFYSSETHATNLGRILRPGDEPLRPNWKALPVGYHGRAGTVVVSGTPVHRPGGQWAPGEHGPTRRLDFEAELGFVVGTPSAAGRPVEIDEFEQHVFGACLVNDWSARDIQAWECVPLGPFVGKSFATSVSPWIVPLEALSEHRIDPPPRNPAPLPYLDDTGRRWALDLIFEVTLNGHPIAHPPVAGLYWTAPQLIAQLTVGGAALRTGDLFATGTVSGSRPDQYGSLVELTWNGRRPLSLPDGTRRTFLEDGDEITITAPGFGAVSGRIEPARVLGDALVGQA